MSETRSDIIVLPESPQARLYHRGGEWALIDDPIADPDVPEEWPDHAKHLGYEPEAVFYGTKQSHALEVYYPRAGSEPRYPYRILVYAPKQFFLETIYTADYPAYQELMLELLDLVQKSLQVHLLSQQSGLQSAE